MNHAMTVALDMSHPSCPLWCHPGGQAYPFLHVVVHQLAVLLEGFPWSHGQEWQALVAEKIVIQEGP